MTRRPDQRSTRPSDETRGLSRATSAHSGDRAASAHSGAARAEPARRGTSGARAEPVETSGPTRADQRGGRLVALELNQWRPAARPELTTAGRARPARSETSGADHRTSDISAGRARPARKRDQRGTSGDRPAGGDQWRKAAGRARSQRFRATSADRSGSVIWGGARGTSARGESQASGDARYEQREGVRGRPKAAGRLAQKLPSPALKEAERSGSYNPGDLNTLTGGTVRSGTVQGQQREEQRTPCPVNLRGPERTRSGEARRVRDTDQGQESVLRRD